MSRHSSLPAVSADCCADESTRQAIESAPLPLEQWLPCGAIEYCSVTVDAHLGPVSVGKVDDANFLQALVCFNNVKLPDEEAVQQDNSATSAMRVKGSFDCLLSNEDTSPFRVKLRMA